MQGLEDIVPCTKYQCCIEKGQSLLFEESVYWILNFLNWMKGGLQVLKQFAGWRNVNINKCLICIWIEIEVTWIGSKITKVQLNRDYINACEFGFQKICKFKSLLNFNPSLVSFILLSFTSVGGNSTKGRLWAMNHESSSAKFDPSFHFQFSSDCFLWAS
jgi:hypothetical protein